MTITEIKNKVIQQLKGLTLDDICSNPMILAKENLNLFTEDEIKRYIEEKYPEVSIEIHKNLINKLLNNYESELKSHLKELNDFKAKLTTNGTELQNATNEKLEKLEPLKLKEEKIKIEVAEMTQALKSTENTAKYVYDRNRLNLIAILVDKEKVLEGISAQILSLDNRINRLSGERNLLESALIEKKNQIDKIEKLKNKEQKKLKLLEKKAVFYEEEYSSLLFLSIVLLKKKFGKSVHACYFSNCPEDEYNKILLEHVAYKQIVPKDWRKIILNILSGPIPKISGIRAVIIQGSNEVKRVQEEQKILFPLIKRESLDLTSIDLGTLLATKIAIKTSFSLITADNEIILGLPSGIFATIKLREKGYVIANFQQQPIELFTNIIVDTIRNSQIVSKKLDIGIRIDIPIGYYILTDNYIIEVNYTDSPILFDSNKAIIGAEIIRRGSDSNNRDDDDDDDYLY